MEPQASPVMVKIKQQCVIERSLHFKAVSANIKNNNETELLHCYCNFSNILCFLVCLWFISDVRMCHHRHTEELQSCFIQPEVIAWSDMHLLSRVYVLRDQTLQRTVMFLFCFILPQTLSHTTVPFSYTSPMQGRYFPFQLICWLFCQLLYISCSNPHIWAAGPEDLN